MLKRPDIEINNLREISEDLNQFLNQYDEKTIEQASIKVKYEDYIEKEKRMVDKMNKLEDLIIVPNFDFDKISVLMVYMGR